MNALILAFKDGGFMMYVILLVGFLAIGITVERILLLWGGFPRNIKEYAANIISQVDKGNTPGAIGLCEKQPNSLTKIMAASLRASNLDERGVQNAVDEVALAELPRLQDRTAYLAVIAQISTLLGLLGTIIGLMISFEAVGGADASQKSALLASGISKALNTTAFGLVVAVPSMLAYTLLQRRTEKLIDLIDECSVTLMNKLAAMRTSRADKSETVKEKVGI